MLFRSSPLALYVTDVSTTIGRRWISGDRLLRPHRRHTYQALARCGWSHRRVTMYVTVLNVILSACGLLAAGSNTIPRSFPLLIALVVLATYVATPRLVSRYGSTSANFRGGSISARIQWTLRAVRPRSGPILVLADITLWFVTLPAAGLLMRWGGAKVSISGAGWFFAAAAISQYVVGAAVGLYRWRWRVGSFGEAGGLALTGIVTGLALHSMTAFVGTLKPAAPVVMVATVLTIVLQVMPRSVWRLKRDGEAIDEREGERALVYGAGRVAALLLPALRDRHSRFIVAGLIDDDLAKLYQTVCGETVVGTGGDLADIARRENVTTVVVCMPSLSAERLGAIVGLIESQGLRPILPTMFNWPTTGQPDDQPVEEPRAVALAAGSDHRSWVRSASLDSVVSRLKTARGLRA